MLSYWLICIHRLWERTGIIWSTFALHFASQRLRGRFFEPELCRWSELSLPTHFFRDGFGQEQVPIVDCWSFEPKQKKRNSIQDERGSEWVSHSGEQGARGGELYNRLEIEELKEDIWVDRVLSSRLASSWHIVVWAWLLDYIVSRSPRYSSLLFSCHIVPLLRIVLVWWRMAEKGLGDSRSTSRKASNSSRFNYASWLRPGRLAGLAWLDQQS